ncbi:hypothetical protein Bca52824_074025 [Brassica carinata]|uniref:Uncharacterized protein n=1 Tax=Brassica carinata TaxID=52824 RepID=A0A8X7U8I7_BRACI|nr:hypothetical protein Bca52824_074025 [Brassica carinata]
MAVNCFSGESPDEIYSGAFPQLVGTRSFQCTDLNSHRLLPSSSAPCPMNLFPKGMTSSALLCRRAPINHLLSTLSSSVQDGVDVRSRSLVVVALRRVSLTLASQRLKPMTAPSRVMLSAFTAVGIILTVVSLLRRCLLAIFVNEIQRKDRPSDING